MNAPGSSTLIADVGIPTIVFTLPAMVVLLVPIIAVEGLLCRKWLRLSIGEAMKLNAASNLVSTLVGVPLAWGFMLALQLGLGAVMFESGLFENWEGPLANVIYVLFASAWISPDETWMLPAATLVLLVPFFFASYWVEYQVMKRILDRRKGQPPDFTYGAMRIAVRNANLVTYGAMFAGVAVWLIVLALRLRRH
ncbi:MAG TPA: hypothetical protein VJW51_11320 [Candidatus Acidoferrales bacterium]|nr:hypothetical protein [Candidatus Acidoferrales bacterium]